MTPPYSCLKPHPKICSRVSFLTLKFYRTFCHNIFTLCTCCRGWSLADKLSLNSRGSCSCCYLWITWADTHTNISTNNSPNSFILTFIPAKKCLRQRSPRSNGKSSIRPCIFLTSLPVLVCECDLFLPQFLSVPPHQTLHGFQSYLTVLIVDNGMLLRYAAMTVL